MSRNTPELTPQQHAAIYTQGKNLLVSAAAGSGKTFVLTMRIVRQIKQEGADISRYLVTTFTNAAAEELKKRIAREITREAADEPDPQTRRRLNEQARLCDFADIGTLHSFCASLLRKYHYTISIQPSFRILAQQSAQAVMASCLDDVLQQMHTSQNKKFFKLLDCYNAYWHSARLTQDILALYKTLQKQPDVAQSIARLQQPCNDAKTTEILILWAQSLLKYCLYLANEGQHAAAAQTDALKCYKEVFESDKETLEALVDLLSNAKTDPRAYDSFLKALETPALAPTPRPRNTDKIQRESLRTLHTTIRTILTKDLHTLLGAASADEQALDRKARETFLVLCEILSQFHERYMRKKTEMNVLDYDDLEHYALLVLQNDTVRKEVQTHYDFVYCDEYQDSSALQERILSLVCRETNFFGVGDIKQSIYAFRGARPDIFNTKLRTYENDPEHNSVIHLQENFRSTQGVAEAINALFSPIMQQETGECAYQKEHLMLSHTKGSEPCEVHLIDAGNDMDRSARADASVLAADTFSQTSARLQAMHCAKLIKTLTSRQIYDKKLGQTRPVRFDDIAILARSVKDIAQIYFDTMRREHIPISVQTENDYLSHPQTNVLIDILTLLDNEQNDLCLSCALRSPLGNVSLSQMAVIRAQYPDEYYFWQSVKRYAGEQNDLIAQRLKAFYETLSSLRTYSLHHTLPELITTLCNTNNLRTLLLTGSDFDQGEELIERLIEAAEDYEATNPASLGGFLSLLAFQKTTGVKGSRFANVEQSQKGVNMMTIHKSKGLEFAYVIVVGCEKNLLHKAGPRQFLYDDTLGLCPVCFDEKRRVKTATRSQRAAGIVQRITEVNEALRIFYVAVSRAKEKFILLACVKDANAVLGASYSTQPAFLRTKPSFITFALSALKKNTAANLRDLTFDPHYILKVIPGTQNLPAIKQTPPFSLQSFLASPHDPSREETFARRLALRPRTSASLPSKLSVSQIKAQSHNPPLTPLHSVTFSSDTTPPYPVEDALLRGNMVHFALEHLPFAAFKHRDDSQIPHLLLCELKKLQRTYSLFRKHFSFADMALIDFFICSSVGRRAAAADRLFRETPFNLKLDASALLKTLYAGAQTEQTLVQGVIDLFFEDQGELILVDYKSDTAIREEAFRGYLTQLAIYREALRTLYPKPLPIRSFLVYVTLRRIIEVRA